MVYRNKLIALMIMKFMCYHQVDAKEMKSYASDYPHLPGVVLVTLSNRAEVSDILDLAGGFRSEPLFVGRSLKKMLYHPIYRILVPASADIKSICARLSAHPSVLHAEPDYLLPVEEIPNDSFYHLQWHLSQIDAPGAWDVAKGDRSVIISIIDTGVDWDHPDLAGNMWENPGDIPDGVDNDGNGYVDDIRGWDFVSDYHPDYPPAPGEDGAIADNDPMDYNGHGTHVAGDAAAVTDNGAGVASVSWNCSIMPLRAGYEAMDGRSYIVLSYAAEAFYYAADQGADIINFSSGSAQTLVDAARYAFDRGVIITKSAGNANSEFPDPLELEPYCITVAAVDRYDQKSWYSDYGQWVSISAPGGPPLLYGTTIDGYGSLQGTSYAAPLVAGTAALLKSYHPEWNHVDIMLHLLNTADDIDSANPQYRGKMGSGRLNAFRALSESIREIPRIELLSVQMDDAATGNGNGIAEAGEKIAILFECANTRGTANNVTARLAIDDWAVRVVSGSCHMGGIPGLRDLSHHRVGNADDPFIIQIDAATIPHLVSGQVLLSNDEGLAQSFPFSFAIDPSILFVDDEEFSAEIYYFASLDSLHHVYDVWNHEVRSAPVHLTDYPMVIWVCGDWSRPSLDDAERTALKDYLDQGGHLFLSGQDIGWDLCDPNPPVDVVNQYAASRGASRDFYENYLHATYLEDDSDYSTLTGAIADPIGDGLSLTIFQPGRAMNAQFPSEILPINDGISIFNYPNNRSGAVRCAGTVYFAFGGYEAIVEKDRQLTVMKRVIDWLNGLSVEHAPLGNTAETTGSRAVTARILSRVSPLRSADLYWDVDRTLPFHRAPMKPLSDDWYQADIPTTKSQTVDYFILARAENGFSSPIEIHSYATGVDMIPPQIVELSWISNSFSNRGPFSITTRIQDNLGVDTASVKLCYRTTSGDTGSVRLKPGGRNIYQGGFIGSFAFGDTVFYRVSAMDLAKPANRSETPERWFIIGLEDFESGMTLWETDSSGWALDSSHAYSGQYSMTWHSDRLNLTNMKNLYELTLKENLDLSLLKTGFLSFRTSYSLISEHDSGRVEISRDNGNSWDVIGQRLHGMSETWERWSHPLTDDLSGDGSEVRIRFSLSMDSTRLRTASFWTIDDVRLNRDDITSLKHAIAGGNMPEAVILHQNYPNPFNPMTTIVYGLAKESRIQLAIHNLMGQRISLIVDDVFPAGQYKIDWDGRDDDGRRVGSGLYFCVLTTDYGKLNRKMLKLN